MISTSADSTSSITDIAAHLRLVITRTARRLRQEVDGDFGPSVVAALATIERFGPLTPSELATREGIQRPSITRIVARLEDAGMIARERDPADGRSCLVVATEAGRAYLHAARSRKDAYLAHRIADLDETDRQTLDRAAVILERLLGLDTQAPGESGDRR